LLRVPTDVPEFERLYHLDLTEGFWDFDGDGLLVSITFARHNGVGAGDSVELIDSAGCSHVFAAAGVYEFYLLHYEFILGAQAYRAEFGVDPSPNTLMVQLAKPN